MVRIWSVTRKTTRVRRSELLDVRGSGLNTTPTGPGNVEEMGHIMFSPLSFFPLSLVDFIFSFLFFFFCFWKDLIDRARRQGLSSPDPEVPPCLMGLWHVYTCSGFVAAHEATLATSFHWMRKEVLLPLWNVAYWSNIMFRRQATKTSQCWG